MMLDKNRQLMRKTTPGIFITFVHVTLLQLNSFMQIITATVSQT